MLKYLACFDDGLLVVRD